MFGSTLQGARAYSEVGVETGVIAASPHQLIVMLFDGALVAIGQARKQMAAGNVPAKGQSISKAVTIITDGLQSSLNKEGGGDIAANLDALYAYMCRRLVVANLNNQPDILDEVARLLLELKQAWLSIGTAATPAAAQIPQVPRAYDPLEPSSSRLVKA